MRQRRATWSCATRSSCTSRAWATMRSPRSGATATARASTASGCCAFSARSKTAGARSVDPYPRANATIAGTFGRLRRGGTWMATLRLVPAVGSHIEIGVDQAVVGRDPNSDVIVNDGSVSRKHARLERRGDGWAVVDQSSANGTFLDGHRVTEAALAHGQEIRFGSVAYRLEIEEELSATIITPMTAPTDATVVQRAVVPPPRPAAPRPAAAAPRPAAP